MGTKGFGLRAYAHCGKAGSCHELGRGSSRAKETPYCAPDSEMHEMRCCSSTEVAGFKKTSCLGTDLWTASDSSGFGGCQHKVTFAEADNLCKKMTARLCTRDELEAGCTKETGCDHDADLLWSSTPGSSTRSPTHVPTRTGGGCKAVSSATGDAGYTDSYRGWYDVQGCGKCNDYCRWVGDTGSGGDPSKKLQVPGGKNPSWWSCRLAGSSSNYSTRNHFKSFPYKKCSGKGVEAPGGAVPPSPPLAAAVAELAIKKITSSSASCDGCSSGTGCDPRGPMRLIKPCDARVCKTTWGCGGSCTAGVLTVNGNGQGEWCSRGGSAESAGGQWLDLDLGSSKTVTSIQLWSGASGKRFPQKLQVLTGGGADGSTNGGNGCFDKKGGLSATDGSWKVAAGPFVTGSGTSLDGCANARSKAGVNTQSARDMCIVPVPAGKVIGRYIRLHFLGTAGNDNYMELRGLKVFGTAADADGGLWHQSAKGTDLARGQWDGSGATSFAQCKAKAEAAGVTFFAWTGQVYQPGYCKVLKSAVTSPNLGTNQGYGYKLWERAANSGKSTAH